MLLVGSGCNVNKSDTESCTALHYASAHDEDAKYDILQLLEYRTRLHSQFTVYKIVVLE